MKNSPIVENHLRLPDRVAPRDPADEDTYAFWSDRLDQLIYFSLATASVATPFVLSVVEQMQRQQTSGSPRFKDAAEVAAIGIISGFLISLLNTTFCLFIRGRLMYPFGTADRPNSTGIFGSQKPADLIRLPHALFVSSLVFLVLGVVVFLWAFGLRSIDPLKFLLVLPAIILLRKS